MEKNAAQKRSYKWPITIGIVIGALLVASFAFAYKLPRVFKYEADSNYVTKKQPNKVFSSLATYNREESTPYLKTGIENTFYSIADDNSIKFFTFKSKDFTEVQTTETLELSIPLYNKEVKVTLYLFKKDGKTEGYGIYKDPESLDTPYAFFKLTDNRKFEEKGYLIYTDYSILDLYKNDKTYSMVYYLSSKDAKPEKLITDKDITVGNDGFPRDGFILIPDDYVEKRTGSIYFLSDRKYEASSNYDLYVKRSLDSDVELIYSGISTPNIFYNQNALYFLSQNEDASFALCKYVKEGRTIIRNFPGTPDKYSIYDNYLLDPSTKTLYNVFSGESNGISTSISISGIQAFAVSKDGKKLALAGNFIGNSEKLLFADFTSSTTKIIDGTDLFVSGNSNITFIDNSVFFLAPSPKLNGVTNFVIPWNAIFSMK